MTAGEAVPVFVPSAYQTFRFVSYDIDMRTMQVRLDYALDDAEHFTEVVQFVDAPRISSPRRQRAFEQCVRLLHLVAGTSYYKTAAPDKISVETGRVSEHLARFLTNLYRNGLAEFAWRNQLQRVTELQITPSGDTRVAVAEDAGLARRTLVPVGGGKDSIVTMETLRGIEEPMLLFSVGAAAPIVATVRRSGLPHVVVRRSLPQRLHELNAQGAYNGHIPITAIVSVLACAAALLHDCDTVCMSNERSASRGSFVWDGAEVNHQYSKGLDFELQLAAVVRATVAADLHYGSLLRPLSEVAIARVFAKLVNYHDVFVSCNRAYRQSATGEGAAWCGDCDKCRFTALVLAPFTTPDAVVRIMGRNLLDDAEQTPGFLQLLGLGADRPLDCVGEIGESRAAMRALGREVMWRDRAVVRAMNQELAYAPEAGEDAAFELGAAGALPPRFQEVIRALV